MKRSEGLSESVLASTVSRLSIATFCCVGLKFVFSHHAPTNIDQRVWSAAEGSSAVEYWTQRKGTLESLSTKNRKGGISNYSLFLKRKFLS